MADAVLAYKSSTDSLTYLLLLPVLPTVSLKNCTTSSASIDSSSKPQHVGWAGMADHEGQPLKNQKESSATCSVNDGSSLNHLAALLGGSRGGLGGLDNAGSRGAGGRLQLDAVADSPGICTQTITELQNLA